MNFNELKAHLDSLHAESRGGGTMAKSHGAAGDFGQSSDYDTAAAMRDLKRTPVVNTKGAHASLRKSLGALQKSMDDLEKPVLGATHVSARVTATKRDCSPAEIESAAHKALAAGAITAAEANHCATHLAMGHMPPPELMAKLEGHAPKAPWHLTKAMALEAASFMVRNGLDMASAMALERSINNDFVSPSVMRHLAEAYAEMRKQK
ncbi:hypothetical protein [Paraburkholderia sp. A1RO-5L]|uniref:hypothetical protein n=1 Tax=Paraburkholderia sp. A1RO-5L TaxID=3028370 RepID=UPI003B7ADC95